MAQSKSEWRRCLLAARSAIPELARRQAADEIVVRVQTLRCWREARTILAYLAIGSEVRADALFTKRVRPGTPVLVPVGTTYGAGRIWARLAGGGAEVATLSPKELDRPVVALVPGVGFDERGMRLGRGAGFYDRALADLRKVGPVTVIGLGYEAQIVKELPCDAWDQWVDIVVTEGRVLLASAESGGAREAP